MTCEKCNGNCQNEDCTNQCNDCSNSCDSCSPSVIDKPTGWTDYKMENLTVTSRSVNPHFFTNPYELVTLDTTKIKTLEDMLLFFQVMFLSGGESIKVNVHKQQIESIKHLLKE